MGGAESSNSFLKCHPKIGRASEKHKGNVFKQRQKGNPLNLWFLEHLTVYKKIFW